MKSMVDNPQASKAGQRILGQCARMVGQYAMIRRGDRVVLGVSGGKDSMTLLWALASLRRFPGMDFSLEALTVDIASLPWMESRKAPDLASLEELCTKLGVGWSPLALKAPAAGTHPSGLGKGTSPCALCSRLRRGALLARARELGATVLALGHHRDDAVDTLLLSLFQEGRIHCFSPVLGDDDIRIIRPMVSLAEKEIRTFASRTRLPVQVSDCPWHGRTRRSELAQWLKSLPGASRHTRELLAGAIRHSELPGWKPPRV